MPEFGAAELRSVVRTIPLDSATLDRDRPFWYDDVGWNGGMLDLTNCQSVDRYPALRAGFGVGKPDATEPIHVHVRIREYGDSSLAVPPVSSSRPDLGRMPVGTLLDCYV